jgi:hypothetical protein
MVAISRDLEEDLDRLLDANEKRKRFRGKV